VDEALEQVDAALDRAFTAGRGRVRLIHGHGTGSLREAVRAHLAKAPHVRSHAPGGDGEGGNGVTVAVLEGTFVLARNQGDTPRRTPAR
jgi:DNA mismatch repair protein MutS2